MKKNRRAGKYQSGDIEVSWSSVGWKKGDPSQPGVLSCIEPFHTLHPSKCTLSFRFAGRSDMVVWMRLGLKTGISGISVWNLGGGYIGRISDFNINCSCLDSSVVEYVLWVYVVLGSNPSSGRSGNAFFEAHNSPTSSNLFFRHQEVVKQWKWRCSWPQPYIRTPQ